MTEFGIYKDINLHYWDSLVEGHYASGFYDVKGFIAGDSRLDTIELNEVGDVTGKSLLHMQCHFGLSSLSWARVGAEVTGVAFFRQFQSLPRRKSLKI